MVTPANIIESLFEKAQSFGKTTLELTKLKVLETSTIVATSLITRISIIIVISMFLLLFNIGLSLFLGELFGKLYYGFFIVAAFYLLAGILFYFYLHKWIKNPVSDLIIKQALQ